MPGASLKRIGRAVSSLSLLAACCAASAWALPPQTTIEYVGHASFLITNASGHRLLTDPYLDRFPLRFPAALAVDVVVTSADEPDHAAVFQLRGDPLLVGTETVDRDGFTISAIALPVHDGRPRRAFRIRAGAVTIAFLGEAEDATPELLALVREADVVLFSPFAKPALLRELAGGTARARTLVPLQPDSRLVGLGPRSAPAALPNIPRRSAKRLLARRAVRTELVSLARTRADRPAPATASLFEGTLATLNWPQVRRAAVEGATVLLPIGVIEAHGPHLGLGADTYLARHHALRVQEHLARSGVRALVAPPLYWGVMKDTAGFPGSLEVRPETLRALLEDVLSALQRAGFPRVVCTHFHGDRTQNRTIAETLAAFPQSDRFRVLDAGRLGGGGVARRPPPRAGRLEPDIHAGAVETRLLLELVPDDVDTRTASKLSPQAKFTPMAYVGDPSAWERESGIGQFLEALAESDAARIAAAVRESSGPALPGHTGGADEEPTAVVERYLAAIGGRERVAALQSLVRTGTLRQGPATTALVVRSAGTRWSLSLQEGRGGHREVFDGTNGWRRDGPGVEAMPPERVALLTSLLAVHGVPGLQPLRGARVVSSEDDSRAGLVRVAGQTPSGVSLDLAFDARSHLLRRIGEAALDDYREVAGVRWPFRLDIGGGRMVVEFDRIEADVPLEDAEFLAPRQENPREGANAR